MKKIKLIPFPIITIVLEMLPFGAVLVFSPSPTDRVRETFSYFSLMPFGYANFAPLITALLTCVIMLLALISIKRSSFGKGVFVVSLIAAIISLLPLIYGIHYYSVIGGIITITLFIESILAIISTK